MSSHKLAFSVVIGHSSVYGWGPTHSTWGCWIAAHARLLKHVRPNFGDEPSLVHTAYELSGVSFVYSLQPCIRKRPSCFACEVGLLSHNSNCAILTLHASNVSFFYWL